MENKEFKCIKKHGWPKDYYVDDIPEYCPYCKCKSDFTINWENVYEFELDSVTDFFKINYIDVIFRCPSPTCNRLTLWGYREEGQGFRESLYINYYISEKYSAEDKIPDSINNISPQFVKIYNQALKAESFGLDEIIGLGYRKAFEFLIKDFIIKNSIDDLIIDDVKKEKKFIVLLKKYFNDDNRIQQLSERIAWLGNDEAHYIRKHTNHDVKDMKIMIRLVLNYIDSYILTDKMISEITAK